MSRSHPNLTFLKSNSSFGKSNKPLRFEAKEMVRSLQVIKDKFPSILYALFTNDTSKIMRSFLLHYDTKLIYSNS